MAQRATRRGRRAVDAIIHEIADTHMGIVPRAAMYARDVAEASIRTRVAGGMLVCLFPNVFALGHVRLTDEARLLASTLAVGDDALATGFMVANMWRISRWPDRSCIVLTTRPHRAVDGISMRLTRTVAPADRAHLSGVPVTSIARTLIELAGSGMTSHQVVWAIREAQFRTIFDRGELEECLVRNQHRPDGAWHITQRALELLDGGSRGTRSMAEDRALPVLERVMECEPLVNVVVETPFGPIEPDFYWPDRKLVVEIDGAPGHGRHADRALDRARDAQFGRMGIRVIRIRAYASNDEIVRRVANLATYANY